MTQPTLNRRQFLWAALLSGLAVGCRRALSPLPTPTTSPVVTATPPVTLAFERRFNLQNEAVSYQADPEGCAHTRIMGQVADAAGRGLPGVTVYFWADDPQQTLALITDAEGRFSQRAAEGLSDSTYHVQLIDPNSHTLLSDVIIAPALPDCSTNLIVINFVGS